MKLRRQKGSSMGRNLACGKGKRKRKHKLFPTKNPKGFGKEPVETAKCALSKLGENCKTRVGEKREKGKGVFVAQLGWGGKPMCFKKVWLKSAVGGENEPW